MTMPKRKKKPKFMDQLGDFFIKKLEKASVRDLMFLSAWLGGTYLAYRIFKGIPLRIGPGAVYVGEDIGQYVVERAELLFTDPIALSTALVASYKFLTTDLEDLQSAIAMVRGMPVPIP